MELLESLNEQYQVYRLGMTIGIFLIFFIVRKGIFRSIFKRATLNKFDEKRTAFVKLLIRIFINIILLVLLAIIWDISFEGLSFYIASFLTIVGVGLFATWSMVSNITASVILFFFFPFKIGSRVKIIDGDNSVQGVVTGLSLFSIEIDKEDGNKVFYPNNLAIQKGIMEIKNQGAG